MTVEVSHKPLSFGQSLNDPRCPPSIPLSSSPILRQHIVHMIKTSSNHQRTTDGGNVRKPFRVFPENKENKFERKPELLDISRTPVPGLRKDQPTRTVNQRGALEKQNSFASTGIRRLQFRPQCENTNLSLKDRFNTNLNVSASSKESSSNTSCEIKGCAITNSTNYVGTQKKRIEIHKKTQKFSASLSEFKRRLMRNQSKFYQNNEINTEQYKVDPIKASAPLQPQPPLTPRTLVSRASIRPALDEPKPRSFESSPEASPKPTYRLPMRDTTRHLHSVETYVLVQNPRERLRGRFDEPIALTMRNLMTHDKLLEEGERNKRDGGKGAANARIHRWLESVHNSSIRPSRTVRFNLTSSSSSSADDSDSDVSY
ncbi:hypothetical protein LOTGIDRAFT_162162 [Lottia gigantea]|uniref:Uncharacterized protein n=1 Tax=Lottia gigantea TaxID=225164 RepID=V4BVS3_LOTGI|nr:hypothetical protein LOTGIDRAFT_162162 [Lottia gigantea]ESO93134.1 hypothetical protein LOTGIDRAFT_162162 [Lottia gigantea]